MSSSEEVLHDKVKVVLLENIHPRGIELLENANFQVTTYDRALEGEELLEIAADCHILGIRSKTQLTPEFFDQIGQRPHRLWTVGCFCIGTNQVDLPAAAANGVTVFNAPFSNTRSVAEKTIAEAIALKRRLFERSSQLHRGEWQKSAAGSHEVRGSTLGIVGYGRIGSQVSVLAETLGMKVQFYDVGKRLALGNAVQVNTMEELLRTSDIVTLHIPGENTENLIGASEIALMKQGAVLLNNARGKIVDLNALAEACRPESEGGRLMGAAVDVFPEEPSKNGSGFSSPLIGMDNIILTPHIGGSTLEAQANIAEEVAEKMVRLVQNGSTTTNVNVPEVELMTPTEDVHRILHLHRNVPGVLSDINGCVSELGVNIVGQMLKTDEKYGYVILDVEREGASTLKNRLKEIPHTIWVRSLLRGSGRWGVGGGSGPALRHMFGVGGGGGDGH